MNQVYVQGLGLCKVLYNANSNICKANGSQKEFSKFSSLNFKKSDIRRGIASIMPLLTKHIASDNTKLRLAVEDIGLYLVKQDHVGPEVLVADHLLSPTNRTVPWRDLAGRLRLLSRVILILGVKSGRAAEPPMTLDFIMSRTIEHIQHPNNHVRSAAINVCMACYKFCGADVEIYFGGLRKSLLDLLHAGFLEVEDEKIRENATKIETPRKTVKFKDGVEMSEEFNFEDKVEEELDSFYLSIKRSAKDEKRHVSKRDKDQKSPAIRELENELKQAIPKLDVEQASAYSSSDSDDDGLIVMGKILFDFVYLMIIFDQARSE